MYLRAPDESDHGRSQHEGRALGRLSGHPGIVAAYDAGVLSDGRPFLIMEFCPGGSLTAWLQPEHRPTEERVREVGMRIADALAEAHSRGVLHRDVKPANILLNRYGTPVLADFGLAAVADLEVTTAEALLVTPSYAPPEAFQEQPATDRSDVFSLAATMYALLSGAPPRDPGAGPMTRSRLLQAAQEPVSPLPAVNWHLMDVLMAALSGDPDARPTASAFRDQLAQLPMSDRSPRRVFGSGSRSSSRLDQPHANVLLTPARTATGRRRRAGPLALAAASVTVLGLATAWIISGPALSDAPTTAARPAASTVLTRPADSPSSAITPTSTTTALGADRRERGSGRPASIQLRPATRSAVSFQTVRIEGTYHGGKGRFIRVERWEKGRWVAFPVPAKTDPSGQFTAFLEFGQPGRWQLRVVDVDSARASNPFLLTVK